MPSYFSKTKWDEAASERNGRLSETTSLEAYAVGICQLPVADMICLLIPLTLEKVARITAQL
jgi:hypothetical protein